MMLRISVILSFLCLSLFFQTAASANPDKIRVLAQPFPPFSMHLPKGQATGLGVEIFRIIAEEMGLDKKDYDVKPVTFKRMYVEVQNAPRRIGIAVSRTAQREKLFKWAGPYVKITSGLLAKKSKNFSIQTIEDLKKYKIASVNNTAPEQALIRQGVDITNLERSFRPQINMYKLARDRVDLMAHPIQSASFIMWQDNLDASDYELVYIIQEPSLYFVFSLDFEQSEIDIYNNALKEFMKTNAYQELIKIYRINDIEIPIR